MATFKKWFTTFIEEKNIDLDLHFDFDTPDGFHVMPYSMVTNAILAAHPSEQAAIKNTIVKIDFANGDVCHYFRHLAQALI